MIPDLDSSPKHVWTFIKWHLVEVIKHGQYQQSADSVFSEISKWLSNLCKYWSRKNMSTDICNGERLKINACGSYSPLPQDNWSNTNRNSINCTKPWLIGQQTATASSLYARLFHCGTGKGGRKKKERKNLLCSEIISNLSNDTWFYFERQFI